MERSIPVIPAGAGDEALAEGLSLGRASATADPARNAVRHAHDFHLVTLILSCPGRVEWGMGPRSGVAGRPGAGDVVVCPAGVPTLVRWDRPFEAISARIAPALLDRVAARAGRAAATLRPAAARRDEFAGTVLRKLADAQPDGAGRALLAESLGTALALHLLGEYAGEIDPPRGEAPLAPADLRRVLDHVERHLASDLSLDRLARVAGLARHHFLRRFRAATGTTPHRFVIGRRVERARGLILAGAPLAEAALAAGFGSQSHLHRHVRDRLGVTPGQLARGQSGTG